MMPASPCSGKAQPVQVPWLQAAAAAAAAAAAEPCLTGPADAALS